MVDKIPLKTAILSANTGLDAIKRAPIVDYDTGRKCLRIQDVSQEKIFHDWGFTDVTDGNYEKFRLKEEDILIARTGASIGVSRYIPFDLESVYNNGLIRIRVDKKTFDPKYIYYLLQSQDFKDHIYAIAFATAAQPNMKIRDFLRFEIPYLPLQQQSYAASFLSNLDDKIELNRQINTTLESMAQALFKSWFVDFDPVIDNALAAGNDIPEPLIKRAEARAARRASAQVNNAAPAAQGDNEASPDTTLPVEIQQLFPDAFVFTEEMGWVPEGWGVEPLDEIANYQNGLALQKFRPEDENDFLPVVKIAQLKKGYADGEEKASPNIKPECIIDDGDVVFSWSGSLMVDIWCGGRAALNQHLFKVTSDEYPKWFFLQLTLHHLAEFQRIAADKAVTMGHIKREHLSQAKCSVPGMDFMEKLSPFFDPLLNKAVLSRLENRALVDLRDSLLPKLLSGQLTIPDAEQQLAEVL